VSAITVYQQFTDSSSDLELNNNSAILIGSFTVSQPVDIAPGSIQTYIRCDVGMSIGNIFNFYVSTSTGGNSNDGIISFSSTQVNGAPNDCNNSSELSLGTTTLPSKPGITQYLPGNIYYVLVSIGNIGANKVFLTTNLSKSFFYGYITAGGFTPSIPISPGIPGFTDFGIATTSQQAYCNTNFSTSSGLLDSLGQSISLGFCNVGVFLFVPSSQAIAQWQNLGSSTQTKIPFSYFYQVTSLYDNLVATTAPSFIDVQFDISSTSVKNTGFGTVLPAVVAFSTSTVVQYLPPDVMSLLRSLMIATIWLGFAYYAYRRVQGLLHKS